MTSRDPPVTLRCLPLHDAIAAVYRQHWLSYRRMHVRVAWMDRRDDGAHLHSRLFLGSFVDACLYLYVDHRAPCLSQAFCLLPQQQQFVKAGMPPHQLAPLPMSTSNYIM